MDFNNKLYKNLLDNLLEGVYALDRERVITYWNKAAEELTGYTASEVIGKPCRDNILMHVDERGNKLCKTDCCPANQSMCEGKSCEKEVFLHHKDGHRVKVRTRISPIMDSVGEVIGAVELFDDHTPAIAAREKIQELERMALVDPLTELGNRRYAEAKLRDNLIRMELYNLPFVILFIEFYNFKVINDRFGHEIGDRVLRMTAKTLSNSIRALDTVSRWGGEEFVAVISHVADEETLGSIAEKCRALVEKSSLTVGADTLTVTISVGASLAKPDDTMHSLLKRTDELMYKSKLTGRNRVSMNLDLKACP
jgi:diguanylate cyclase (GGDEF)-like protein/PAS domain S-box-containing protein